MIDDMKERETDEAPERLHCGCVAGGPHTTDCPTVLGDIARREQRWKDPDWKCPRCEAWNFAVRSACRLCGFDPALVLDEKPMETGGAPPNLGEYVCDHDYCDLEECSCKCHQDAAGAAVRELATFTDQPLSKTATIRRQHILICELRERANEYLTTLRAVAVEGLGLTDPWAETATDEAPDEWTGLLSEKVSQLRRERDEARTDAAARLKQMLNQADLDRHAIKEWEQALIKATDLLRPFASVKFVPEADDPIINGAKQSDFDAARVFLDGFDSRRKAKKGRV